MILLLVSSFCGYFSWFTQKTKASPGAAVFLTAASILTAIYVFGFSPILRESVYAIFGLGLGLLVWAALEDFRKNKRNIKSLLSSPAILIFVFFSLLTYFAFDGAWFQAWDEISHWGLVLKEMLLYNRNLKPGDVSWIAIYPPGAAAFQYYFNILLGPEESHAYTAQAILMISPLVQLLDLKAPYRVAGRGIFIAGFFLIFAFFNGWKMIYVDAAVSLFFMGALVFFLFNGPFSRTRLLWFIPIFVSLGLIKYIGNLLAMIVLILIVTRSICWWHADIRKLFRTKRLRCFGAASSLLLVLFSLYALPKLSLLIWSNRTIATIMTPVVYTPREPITAAKVVAIFTGEGLLEYQTKLISRFRDALSTENLVQQRQAFVVASVSTFISILILLIAIAAWQDRERRRTILVSQAVLTLGFASYMFGLLVLYNYRFNEFEGSNLASFSRYVSIYLNAWLVVSFIQVVGAFRGKWIQIAWSAVLCIFVSLFFATNKVIDTFSFQKGSPGVRQEIRAALDPVIRTVPLNKKVYVVWQKTTGYELYVMRFELAPRETNMSCWGLGKPWSAEDIWTCNKSVNELQTEIAKFDYLFLGFTDDDFWNKYSDLFGTGHKPDQHRFFQVQKTGDKFALLPLD